MGSLTQKKTLFIFAALLLAIVNGTIYLNVWLNQWSEPTSVVKLTQRELSFVEESHHDDSALYLHLKWRGDYRYAYRTHMDWLDEKKLRELGFRVQFDENGVLKRTPQRELFIVLEMNGKCYQNAIEYARKYLEDYKNQNQQDYANSAEFKARQKSLEEMETKNSRLCTVDAGSDPELLRHQYPDKTKYIILKGVINIYGGTHDNVSGVISQFFASDIFIPLRFHQKFVESQRESTTDYQENLLGGYDKDIGFEATVAIGSRYEPYIIEVK